MNAPRLPSDPRGPSDSVRPVGIRWMSVLRRSVLLGVGLAVGIGLFYGVENLRGWRVWKAEQERIQAAGRKVRFEEFIPPAVPDEKNFALIPALRPLLETNPDPQATNQFLDPAGWQRTNRMLDFGAIHGVSPNLQGALAHAVTGQTTDLAAWQTYFRTPGKPGNTRISPALRQRYGLPEAPPSNDRAGSGPDAALLPGYPLPAEPCPPAEDVLRAVAVFEADFAEIHEGLKRPESRFPLQYEKGYGTLLPHLAVLKRWTMAFSLRSAARLATGDPAGAFSDVQDAFGLVESIRSEPFNISLLVRQACAVIALGAFWEGQIQHAWSEPQLASFQARFATIDFVASLRNSLGMERAMALRSVEWMAGSLAERKRYADITGGFLTTTPGTDRETEFLPYLLLAPRGWLYANIAATAQALEPLETLNLRQIPGLRDRWDASTRRGSFRYLLHDRFFGGEFGKRFAETTVKACATDQRLRLATVACALERHRLRHGAYPERLEALVPAWLDQVPADPIDGQPLRYAPDPDGSFRLWSVGEDGQDDHGAWPGRPQAPSRMETGDWVWRWPAEAKAGGR